MSGRTRFKSLSHLPAGRRVGTVTGATVKWTNLREQWKLSEHHSQWLFNKRLTKARQLWNATFLSLTHNTFPWLNFRIYYSREKILFPKTIRIFVSRDSDFLVATGILCHYRSSIISQRQRSHLRQRHGGANSGKDHFWRIIKRISWQALCSRRVDSQPVASFIYTRLSIREN